MGGLIKEGVKRNLVFFLKTDYIFLRNTSYGDLNMVRRGVMSQNVFLSYFQQNNGELKLCTVK